MKKKMLEDYFSFTKRERVAVICLVILVIIIFVGPRFLPKRAPKEVPADVRSFVKATDNNETEGRNRRAENNYTPVRNERFLRSSIERSKMFYFDPNQLPAAGWEKLGLRQKTIQTIQNYLSKGGRFRDPDDIEKIYGLHEEEIQQLKPFVRIADSKPVFEHSDRIYKKTTAWPERNTERPPPAQVNINSADTAEFIALPGIGSKLASRIVRFRESLGGFYSVDQLAEVYGIPDSTFQMLKPRLVVANDTLTYIDINTADENRLKSHPYLRWNLAKLIVAYRQQHGPFQATEDLLQSDCLQPEVYRKILPYLKISIAGQRN